MRSALALGASLALLAAAVPAQQVTFASLLAELTDLDRLTRWPDPEYRTIQFSSTDRRSTTPDRPGWFANADGFGQEPIPGFEAVLKEPDADGVGEYLVCDVEGPGAIVRGWSAGMDGVLRVFLDGSAEPMFESRGDAFFARRSRSLMSGLGELHAARALLEQEDADHLPIPFAKQLRITWTGRVRDLHFYQLQVRRYAAGTTVATFDPATAAETARLPLQLLDFVDADRENGWSDATATWSLAPGESWSHVVRADTAASLRELVCTLAAADVPRALRGVLLRIACDGSPVPQVEAPLGDFFGTAAGIHPFASLPLSVAAGGMKCSWPMPYRAEWRIELVNRSGITVEGTLRHRHAPLPGGFDDRTLYFHALWRADHALEGTGGARPFDVPYVTAIGKGRLVGLGCQIVNPPMHASWRSNWWGEGDEKIAVDGVFTTLGTGSEDYFDYSWSHWRWFAHPYAGQPLASGPGNCGYVTNHRFQVIDDLPFERSLAAAMELWTHRPVSPLSYARIAWLYARPGLVTDHRALQAKDLVLPALPPWSDGDFGDGKESLAWRPGGVRDGFRASGGAVIAASQCGLTRSGALLRWKAPPGGRLELPFAAPEEGQYLLRILCRQGPGAPAVQVELDGERLRAGEKDTFVLAHEHGERLEDLVFDRVQLTAGTHALALVCPAGGDVGVDLAGWERRPPPDAPLPGAVEAELWDLVRASDGVTAEIQRLGSAWSAGHHRWVKCRRAGDTAVFRIAAPKPGRYRVTLRLTSSWDYGVLHVDWNGERAAEDVDTWCGASRRLGVREVVLGERDLTKAAELAFTLAGSNAASEPPGTYFGIDCVVLSPAAPTAPPAK